MHDLLLFSEQLRDFASGLGTYARGLARGLAARGHAVTVAVPAGQEVKEEGYRSVPMPFARGNLTPLTRGRMARAAREVLAAESAGRDRIHFLDARWALLLPPSPPGVPVIGTVHDSYALDWTDPGHPRSGYRDRPLRSVYYRWLRGAERRTYRRLSILLANSDHVAGAIGRGYGVPADRIRVVRLGLPPAEPAAPADLPGDPSVLFVGGNFQRKGLDPLLRAAALLRTERPGLVVHVVGGDPRADAFRRLAAREGIGDRVVFHGWRPNDEVRSMMAAATLFAMPSLVEAFGLVYLEAMRAGTPVIATSKGGAAECFAAGREALLVDPGDVDGLASAIRGISGDPDLRARLSEGGREAAGRLTFEATIRETEAAYDAATPRR